MKMSGLAKDIFNQLQNMDAENVWEIYAGKFRASKNLTSAVASAGELQCFTILKCIFLQINNASI